MRPPQISGQQSFHSNVRLHRCRILPQSRPSGTLLSPMAQTSGAQEAAAGTSMGMEGDSSRVAQQDSPSDSAVRRADEVSSSPPRSGAEELRAPRRQWGSGWAPKKRPSAAAARPPAPLPLPDDVASTSLSTPPSAPLPWPSHAAFPVEAVAEPGDH